MDIKRRIAVIIFKLLRNYIEIKVKRDIKSGNWYFSIEVLGEKINTLKISAIEVELEKSQIENNFRILS
jgi:hypothetical protein